MYICSVDKVIVEMGNPFFYKISEISSRLIDKILLRGWILHIFFFVFPLNFYAQEQTIFVTEDAQIINLDKNIKIVKVKTEKPVKSKKIAYKKPFVNKKPNTKQNIVKGKPSEFIYRTNSDQNIIFNSGSNHKVSTTNRNHTVKTELTFHYRALNIPISVHLEKKYSEEISLSSEYSKFFFSRPPPIV